VHAPHDLHGLGALVVVEARARARGAPICGLPRGGGCALLHRVSQGLEAGVIQKPPAPAIAINYWRLPANARLKGVVTVVRADKVHHHDVKHFASVRTLILQLLPRITIIQDLFGNKVFLEF
jgi:hypothetical protein